MAGPTLCVACSQLPVKEAAVAARRQRCPECQSNVGVTSYGARFRFTPAKRRQLLSPTLFKGATVGAGLLAFVVLVIGLGLWISEERAPTARVPDAPPGQEFSRIPEVAFLDPFPQHIQPHDAKSQLRGLIGSIRAKNEQKQDGFLIAQIDRRPELRGLPFVMGDACRIDKNRATSFQSSVQAVRDAQSADSGLPTRRQRAREHHDSFWETYLAETAGQGTNTDPGIAALTQILAPERLSLRAGLVQRLTHSNRPDATRALAKAAVFDPASEVRNEALKALKDRPREEASEILLQGLRYPLASVAKHAAVAMILLDRKDLLPKVEGFLKEPAPGDPVVQVVDQQKVCVVREVVRVNHHRNCLLCHTPTATGSTEEVPGVIPIPGSPFPSAPSEAYGSAKNSDDPMVRADTTYLRQDFSMLLPVANAAPWPEMQRFDFLVRTRVVEGKELAVLQQQVHNRPADYLSANHQAAQRVLRELK